MNHRASLSPIFLVCGVMLATLLAVAGALPATAGKPQVTVSKAAATLPGPRYSWFPMPQVTEAERDARVQDERFRADLQAALDRALQAKGYRRTGAGETADLVMAYRVGARDIEETTVRDDAATPTPQSAVECGLNGCSQIVMSGAGGTPVPKLDTVSRTEGGLLVEVLEPGSVRVLWRALNRGTVEPGKVTQSRLDRVASETLAQLPPAPR